MGRKKKVAIGTQLLDFEKKQANNDTIEQREFIQYNGVKSIILAATAGAGKTYSCVQRLNFLIENGVQPERILFLSFTVAAADELKKRVGRSDIKISTIHSLAGRILYVANKGKKIVSFYDFINWFVTNKKPIAGTQEQMQEYRNDVDILYNEGDQISAKISAFKLEAADGMTPMLPPYLFQYNEFIRDQKARDFSDMLIDARECLKDDRVLSQFKNMYDYIFVDEYQDTSSIQFEILLSMNARHYYLIGDRNQMIYGYSGANCTKIENMLRERREVEEKSLTVNFRSDKEIVQNSNLYSSLQAIANSQEDGVVHKKMILNLNDLKPILAKRGEVAVLVRDNKTIKKIEEILLSEKFPMRYTNYISREEILDIKKGNTRTGTKHKLDHLKKHFDGNENNIISFIEEHQSSNSFITSIHKSKGREFETCVVVNSVSRELLKENGFLDFLTEKQLSKISFQSDIEDDNEEKNIHYVAISRSKNELYFMIFN